MGHINQFVLPSGRAQRAMQRRRIAPAPSVILRAVAGSTVAMKPPRRGGSCDSASLRAGWRSSGP